MKETVFETMAGGTSDVRRSIGESSKGHFDTTPPGMPRQGDLRLSQV